jgi:hypothetical protein
MLQALLISLNITTFLNETNVHHALIENIFRGFIQFQLMAC